MILARIAVSLVVASYFFSPVAAHQDRILSIDPDGALVGLPETYLPAFVEVKYGHGIASVHIVTNLSLSIAGTRRSIPSCLLNSLVLGDEKEIRFLASWYHDKSLLPPYLAIEFPGEEGHSGTLDHMVLIGLDDLEIIEIWRRRKVESGARLLDRLELDAFCPTTGSVPGRENGPEY